MLLSTIQEIQKTALELQAQLTTLSQEEPYKAYIAWIELWKVADWVKKESKDWFQKYYDDQKEIPGGYEVRVTLKRTYDFSQNAEWSALKQKMEALEAWLKYASDSYEKWVTPVNSETGELLQGVPVSYSTVYTVTKRK